MNGISFSLYDALNKLIIGAIALSPFFSPGDITKSPLYFTVAAFLCGLLLWLILALINGVAGCISRKWPKLKSKWIFRLIIDGFFGSNSDVIIDKSFKNNTAYPAYRPFFEKQKKKCGSSDIPRDTAVV